MAYIYRLEGYKREAGNQGGSGRTRTTATAILGDTGKRGKKETGTGSRIYSARAVHRPGSLSYNPAPLSFMVVVSTFPLQETLTGTK